jgi:adenylate kinase
MNVIREDGPGGRTRLHGHPRRWFVAGVALCGLLLAAGGASPALGADAGSYFVLIGAPAAGKTTIGTALAEKHGVPLVTMTTTLEKAIEKASRPSGSAARRRAQQSATANARKALNRLKNGELVGDIELSALLAARLSEGDCDEGFVLDGFPGSQGQAVFLDALLAGKGVDQVTVVYLDIPDELALERMKERGRADDKKGFGEERLKQFREEIALILEFYEGPDLHVIDSSAEAAQTMAALEKSLEGQ